MDCAVVVVTYESAQFLPRLLDSLPAAAGGRTYSVVVVDNASTDRVRDVVRGRSCVRFVQSDRNLGYSGGINLAARDLPDCRWVLVLNPDLTLGPGAISAMIETALRTGAAAVVPRIVDGDGQTSFSLRREPTLRRSVGEALLGDHVPGRPGWASEIVRGPAVYGQERTVDWATGAAMLVSRSVFDHVGPWDTRYFLYSEETDFCRRIRAAGGRIRYTPTAVVSHSGGGSGTSPALVALCALNRVRYAHKWHGGGVASAAWGVAVVHALLRITRPGERASLRVLTSARARRLLPGASTAAGGRT
ncbi:Glycosyltransferase, GT2 family [Geodermatophilus saharensis]|uniref:Glycosyltransferase, GT2 family n=1 Tax=Geodermatophilus saharensis TaxID=1137994 RepID=A0A239GEM6_9ACTN|nr:Glycosyltransferase, GT2 family [Geodermatophilus saharensis]